MFTTGDISALRDFVGEWRKTQQRVALVPTMGNLHAGHLSLVEHAKTLSDRVVATIFINPLQFDRSDDLARYPRTFDSDKRQLQSLGVDLLFAPDEKTIYPRPKGETTRVEVPELSDILCGDSRPGHFVGVTTVVTKLINIVTPDVAVFGEKDFQQLMMIRRVVDDLNIPVEIEGVATVREEDGLAMSSRNNYLTPEERAIAPGLHETLQEIAGQLKQGSRDFAAHERAGRTLLSKRGFKPDYIHVRSARNLSEPTLTERELVVVAAAFLGRARLIDNVRISLM